MSNKAEEGRDHNEDIEDKITETPKRTIITTTMENGNPHGEQRTTGIQYSEVIGRHSRVTSHILLWPRGVSTASSCMCLAVIAACIIPTCFYHCSCIQCFWRGKRYLSLNDLKTSVVKPLNCKKTIIL